jgi:6,7-dimethyl-8-ribityllumazine synthase
MAKIRIIDGDLNAGGVRYALVASRFNSFIVDHLVQGALDVLHRHGVADDDVDLIRVPGAFELPLAAKRAAASRRYGAVIALGAIIRGATPHFDYIAGSCIRGLADVALSCDLPVICGVLTVNSIEQAIERAGTKAGNKGADAALSALEMVGLLRKLES